MNIYETAPARRLISITKSDSTVLSGVRALWIGTGGDVAVLADGDTAPVTITNVANGSLLPVKAMKVMSTNTTASGIVGFI